MTTTTHTMQPTITLAAWDAVRVRRCTFVFGDHAWVVEKRPVTPEPYLAYEPHRSRATRTFKRLEGVALLLSGGVTIDPSWIYGTLGGHVCRPIGSMGSQMAVMQLVERARSPEGLRDRCGLEGHLLPPDLTLLEANLLWSDDAPSGCMLNGREV